MLTAQKTTFFSNFPKKLCFIHLNFWILMTFVFIRWHIISNFSPVFSQKCYISGNLRRSYNYNCTIHFLKLQIRFYNCRNCDQLHVKICPVGIHVTSDQSFIPVSGVLATASTVPASPSVSIAGGGKHVGWQVTRKTAEIIQCTETAQKHKTLVKAHIVSPCDYRLQQMWLHDSTS